jgi:hypothetical protein
VFESIPSPKRSGRKVGATTGELDHVSQAFGQAVPMGVVTETGIAGLTLAHRYLNTAIAT